MEKARAVAETPEQRPLPHARLARDRVHREALRSALAQQTPGRLEQRLPVARGVGALASRTVQQGEVGERELGKHGKVGCGRHGVGPEHTRQV